MKNNRYLPLCGLILFFLSACSQPVLKQDIPVTTNPMGAKIYANGQFVGTTPASVGLERNRDHILTLVKENYRQEDVVVSRKYQQEKTYLKAIQSGVSSGLFFKNAGMGVSSSLSSLSSQENTGEAYTLFPPAVKVTLVPTADATVGQVSPQQVNPDVQPTAEVADEPSLNKREMGKGLLLIGAAAALSQVNPLEKKKEVSSSSKSYIQPDGTRVTQKSSASVGIGINPAGLINVLDTLFK